MRLVITERAEHDLGSIIAHIALDDRAAAERVYRRIVEAADRLTDFPNIGHAGRLPDTRELVVRGLPYLIVYQAAADTVTVLAVFHAARDLARALAARRDEGPENDREISSLLFGVFDYEGQHREVAMNANAGIRLKNPAHPGGFIRHEIIAPLGLSVTAAADALGVTRATLSTLLNERARLSPEMALRVEKAFGVSMDTLMRMQNSYDIAQTRKRAGEIKVERFKGKPLDPQPAAM